MIEIGIIISILPAVVIGCIAIGKLTTKVKKNCSAIDGLDDNKVNKETCKLQHRYIDLIWEQLKAQLDRIEEKIDGTKK